jgi:hypothetical protein
LGRYGEDFDDRSCYPSITAGIIPIGSHMANLFTTHKERILTAIGLFYFPELNKDLKEAKERGKALCHRLDYNGSTYGFAMAFGLPANSDTAGYMNPNHLNIPLHSGETFNLQKFILAIQNKYVLVLCPLQVMASPCILQSRPPR